MTTVNGFRARRLECALSIQQLADLSHLSPYIIRQCERGEVEQITLRRLLSLADTLGISLSEGCRMHSAPGSRQRPRRHAPRNVLECYMDHWGLTLHGLALILDVSVQTASIQCAKQVPDAKYIQCLAVEDGLSVPDFLEFYRALACA